MIRDFFEKHLKYFLFFYRQLRYRSFVALIFSMLVGVTDGFGLAMILPLLQMVSGDANVESSGMGNLKFIVDFMEHIGLKLTLETVLITMVSFFTAKGVMRFFEIYYLENLRYFFIMKMRSQNINALKDLSYKHFVLSDSGRIQSTLSGEINRVVVAFNNYFSALQQALMVIVYLGLAFLANSQLAIMVGFGGFLTNLIYRMIYKRSKEHSVVITKANHHFQGLLIQMVAFFKYLKASAGIHAYAEKLREKAMQIEIANRKLGLLRAVMESTREPFIMLIVVSIIIVQVGVYEQTLGPIILSLLLLYRALTVLLLLQVQWNGFLAASGAVDNMSSFMKELAASEETYALQKCPGLINNLSAVNVSFAYNTENVLSDINLIIEKNQTVAFVGESGSGKTTLVNLFTGMLPPSAGAIQVDDVNLNQYDVRSFQENLGYITQEPVIFSDTLFNNVTFWSEKNEKNLLRFWNALKKASLDDFVRSLPDQEEAPLGSNGILVSGGQKQRISIARELYKEVEILIMDEATSALDSKTEKNIQQNIEFLKGKYTFLIVAHRLSTVKHADKIVMMRGGHIEGVGNFEELTAKSESFRKMVELQEL